MCGHGEHSVCQKPTWRPLPAPAVKAPKTFARKTSSLQFWTQSRPAVQLMEPTSLNFVWELLHMYTFVYFLATWNLCPIPFAGPFEKLLLLGTSFRYGRVGLQYNPIATGLRTTGLVNPLSSLEGNHTGNQILKQPNRIIMWKRTSKIHKPLIVRSGKAHQASNKVVSCGHCYKPPF